MDPWPLAATISHGQRRSLRPGATEEPAAPDASQVLEWPGAPGVWGDFQHFGWEVMGKSMENPWFIRLK